MATSGFLKNNKISASQLSTWIKSKKDYERQYIIGEPFTGNKYTEFGQKIHKQIEEDVEILDLKIPKLKNREMYFEKELDNFIINGFLDSYDIGEIIDYKVSKQGKWSQKDIEKNIQLKFYGFWHFLENRTLPTVKIVNIEYDEISSKLELNGKMTEFVYLIKPEDIFLIREKINEFINWCNNYDKTRIN